MMQLPSFYIQFQKLKNIPILQILAMYIVHKKTTLKIGLLHYVCMHKAKRERYSWRRIGGHRFLPLRRRKRIE